MKLKRLSAVLLFMMPALLGIAETKEDSAPWQVVATKFTLNRVPALYESYAAALPAMLNLFCDVPASRLVTIQEKKMRRLVDDSAKKLSLIKERASLITERDALYLAVLPESKKKKKRAALNKKIAVKEADIKKAQEKIDKLLADTSFTAQTSPFAVWKGGQQVLELPEYANIPQSLKNDTISAVVTGTIEDIAGYMYVSVVLTTGLPGMSEHHFSEAGPYQSIEAIARSLAAQIMVVIRNTKPARVRVRVEPQDAKVYIDNEYLDADKKIIPLYEGRHRLEAIASGYDSAGKTIEAQAGKSYELIIKLKKTEMVSVGFTGIEPRADVFLHTQYLAGTPFQTEVAVGKKTVLTFSYSDVKSYIVLHPRHFTLHGQDTYQLHASLNKEKTETLVNRRRNILYWSLGAFYISLPIFMILQGITNDMAFAVKDKRVAATQAVQQKYRALYRSTMLMQGITICLGINYAVQLGLYLYAADQSIPKEAEPLK